LRVIKAQTTRAFLFASATEARRGGRRWSTARSHAPASLFHCPARLTIDVAPTTSKRRISLLPALVIRPRRVLPPVEFCRGTKPSHAAKCRALLNEPILSPTVATISEAVYRPRLLGHQVEAYAAIAAD
jgi:hypothetical protein